MLPSITNNGYHSAHGGLAHAKEGRMFRGAESNDPTAADFEFKSSAKVLHSRGGFADILNEKAVHLGGSVEADDGVESFDIREIRGVANGVDVPMTVSEVDIAEGPDPGVESGGEGLKRL
jgi:hypothetical protein